MNYVNTSIGLCDFWLFSYINATIQKNKTKNRTFESVLSQVSHMAFAY